MANLHLPVCSVADLYLPVCIVVNLHLPVCSVANFHLPALRFQMAAKVKYFGLRANFSL